MNHSGFTMGKVRQISADSDGFRFMNDDSCSRIGHVKNSSNAIPIGSAFNPAVTIANSAVPGFWLFLPSFAHGDF